nr:MAG TPA: Protein of unknown function (DUF2533) [Caudoviricetes sp.]
MNIDEAIRKCECGLRFSDEEYEEFVVMMEDLREYQQLEEQGRLVKLPCKVGDIVYEIIGATTRGYEWKYLTYEKAYVHGTVFSLSRINDIGKTIFLTKAEAEEKLKELQDGQ